MTTTTQEQIKETLDVIPNLRYLGVNSFDEEDPDRLLHSFDEFERAVSWAKGLNKIQSINPNRSSYGLKHLAEDATGDYISNGVMIAAMIHCGFNVRAEEGCPNVWFNVSQRSPALKDKNPIL